MSIEALASYVVNEIALDGDYGTPIPKLFQYVRSFYRNRRQRRFQIVKLSESAPVILNSNELDADEESNDDHSNYFPTQPLDLELRKEIWKRLVTDPDFKVGKNDEGRNLELEEIEKAYGECVSETRVRAQEGDVGEGDGQDKESGWKGIEVENAQHTKPKKWRVYASTEQRWKALTGHSIDHKKVPPKFFDLLTEIGHHREEGILQPILTKATNQDARSVGPRTAALAAMGYIEKINVLAAKLRTSKLTLQRYATIRDLKEKRLRKQATQEGVKPGKHSVNAPWTGDTVDVRKMVEAIFAELRRAKNNVLMHNDIKRKLGMDKSRFHFRAFARIIRRVEKTGCLKRIRVPLNLTRHKKSKSSSVGLTDKCLARCVKLTREPNVNDWEQTLNVTLKCTAEDADEENGDGVNDGDEEKVDNVDDVDYDAVAKLENTEGDLLEESSRILPSWVADRSLENVIYDAVDAAGIDGVSSMDLHQIIAGRFYYRPLDQILRRLGDNPLKSQPPHLLHLAIIRETDIEGRHTHYRYFSYRWHQNLVKAGLGKPVGSPKKVHVKGKKKELIYEDLPATRITVATDDLGFSFIDKRRLLKSDGSSTLQEAQQRLAAPESAHILKSKYTIETTDDGKSSVRWTNWNRTPKRESAIGKQDGRDDATPVRRGRPPKFAHRDDRDGTLVPGLKSLKPDEHGVIPQVRPRGRPRLPDHLLKKPRKPRKGMAPILIEEDVVTNIHEGTEQNEQIVPIKGAVIITEPQENVIAKQTAPPEVASAISSGDLLRNTQDIYSFNLAQEPVKMTQGVPIIGDIITARNEKGVSESSSKFPPKRRGRPPKNGTVYDAPSKGTPRYKRSSKSSVNVTPQISAPAMSSTPLQQDAKLVQTVEEVLPPDITRSVEANCTNGRLEVPKSGDKVQKESEVVDITMTDAPIVGGITLAQESPMIPIQVSYTGEYIQDIKGTKETDISNVTFNLSPQGTPQQGASRSTRFSASVDAMEEAIAPVLTISPEETPSLGDSTLVSPLQPVCQDLSRYSLAKGISRTTEVTPTPITKGRIYNGGVSSSQRLPRTEPTMALEEVDDTSKMSYGSAGGMLMIARQRVILELMEDNGGVFPGGLEIKHAFESRYKRKNPKAGQPDRRLMVSLVSSLQRSGKINQIVINFINSRGLRQTKRILADAKLPLDHPQILEMKNSIVAADGNLWFPAGTEIPKEVQKLVSSARGLPSDPGAIESVEFERMYTPQRQLLKSQRAEASRNKRLARIEHQREFPRFTAQQKELAAKRLEMRRRRAAFSRIKPVHYAELRDEDAHFDQWGIKEVPTDLVDRPDVREFSEIVNFTPAPSPDARILLHEPISLPIPHKEENCESGIQMVYNWEKEQVLGGEEVLGCYFGFNMINHFAPPAKTVGTDFAPVKVSMSNLIYQPDFRKGRSNPFAAKKYSSRRKTGSKTLEASERIPKPKRRRIVGPLKQKKTRREQAMAELHHGAEAEEDTALQEVPPKTIIPRKRHSFDYEQDDVLLAAIVIVRTLFGGFDRRIDWNLVATVFPDYDMATLKARWPRVRDAHKTHLKKLQIDFEEVYLDAYGRGLMPEITRGEIGDFNLPWHCRWFKDNVTVPDAKSIPALTKSRDIFDLLYDLRAEKPSWRDEYHNSALTGQNRINFLSSHPYEVQVIETKTDLRPYEDGQDVECIKSLIKANVLTDSSVYDARKAYGILSSFPVGKVDTAFYFLTGNKTLAPKKDAEKLVPGRNYEFTERFHLSLRVPLGGRIWTQAAAFEKIMDQEFASNHNDQGAGNSTVTEPGEFNSTSRTWPTMALSPFMNDGSMVCLLNLIAHRRITLDKSRYVSNISGLVKGYRTRSMEKAMIDFPITISPTHLYYTKLLIPLPPEPVANSQNWTQMPVRVWYDIMGNLVQGMWKKVVAAVLGTVAGRPGIGDIEVSRVLCPGVTIAEVELVCDWLEISGVLLRRRVNGVKASFVKEGFWWGLLGQMDRERVVLLPPRRDDQSQGSTNPP